MGFTQNGNAISAALDHYTIPIRAIGRDTDCGGTSARLDFSFQGFAQLIDHERARPGRKIIVWVSPGWPLLFGLQHSDKKLQQQVFGNIAEIFKQLQEGQITLDSIDPSALGDIGPGLTDPPTHHVRPVDRKPYIEAAARPSEVRMGSLALEAIATQTGGLALHSGNDIAAQLQECIAAASAYYQLSFDPPATDRSDEYHSLLINVAKPGLTARTRHGYYSQPGRPENFTAAPEKPGMPSNDALPHEPATEGGPTETAAINPTI